MDASAWFANDEDFPWVQYLLRKYRNFEFFYTPDETLRHEIHIGNVICCDYNRFEAGYVWATFVARTGRCRFNHVAITEELWRKGVGAMTVSFVEREAVKRGLWATYLSCNTNTPGHKFWPAMGYKVILSKSAGASRGGENLIWGKVLKEEHTLFGPKTVYDIKSSYTLQYSMNDGGHSTKPAQLVLPGLEWRARGLLPS